MEKRTTWTIGLLALAVSLIELTGLPARLFVNITLGDITPFYWTVMVNFLIIGVLSWAVLHFLLPDFSLGMGKAGFRQGFQKYGHMGLLIAVINFIGFYVGLFPFDAHPSFYKVLIEGVIYNLGLAIAEEFYVRGLLITFLERILKKRPDRTFLSVILSALLFGLGHIPGVLGLPFYVIACKLVLTTCIGFFLGMVYKRSSNLWLPILMHFLINLGALPCCFTSSMTYPPLLLVIIVPACVMLGIYSLSQLEQK